MRICLLGLAALCLAVSTLAKAEPKVDFSILPIAENVYMHTSYRQTKTWGRVPANGLVVVVVNEDKGRDNKKKKDDAYIIDTPWSKNGTAELVNWLKAKNLNIAGAIATHAHEDRTAGFKVLNELGIPTYSSEQSYKIMQKNQQALASYQFDPFEFEWVDDIIQLDHIGPGHTADNLVAWLPQQRILFGGCLVKSLNSKTLGNIAEADIDQWPDTLRAAILKYGAAEQVVPGHGAVGDMKLLAHTYLLVDKERKKQVVE